jgi:hypothetical protein
MVRKVPNYKRATQAQVIVAPEAKHSRNVPDSNSGHVQVVNQKTDFFAQRADTRGFMPKASRAHVASS